MSIRPKRTRRARARGLPPPAEDGDLMAHQPITLSEVCRLFGVTPGTARRWHRTGELPGAFKVGQQLFWQRQPLADLLAPRGRRP